MGDVPTNSESAASAAAESIISALNQPDRAKVFMIDISLPSLDPASGSNIYDDVGAVEFCYELVKKIHSQRGSCASLRQNGSAAIVVRDANLVSRSKRVLEDDLGDSTSENEDVEYFDDFADFGVTIGASELQKNEPTTPDDEINQKNKEIYRIGSFLGSADPPSGPNMLHDMVKLVAKNALAASEAKEEDIIIMMCPISQAELVGVRWLVSKYGGSKTIVIVNNRLHPLPQELMASETVYSVLPLIARSVGSASDNPNPSPKIVLLRRYPKAWEIHVDVSKSGAGFELASEVPASEVGVRGPSMEYIGNRVKEFMQLKFGG